MRKVTVDRNTVLQNKLIPIVRHEDNVCIVGRMKEVLKQAYEEWKRTAKEVGLSFNENKMKECYRPGTTHTLGRKRR
jgi:hypothetical protein